MDSGIGREMCVLDGRGNRRSAGGSFGVNLGHPIVTNVDFTTHSFNMTFGKTCCSYMRHGLPLMSGSLKITSSAILDSVNLFSSLESTT